MVVLSLPPLRTTNPSRPASAMHTPAASSTTQPGMSSDVGRDGGGTDGGA